MLEPRRVDRLSMWLALVLAALHVACGDSHDDRPSRTPPAKSAAAGRGGAGGSAGDSGRGGLCTGFDCRPPVGGTEACARDSFRQDNDGLPFELELDAGLDACNEDSDSDGCGDAAEFYLGGCDAGALLRERCYSGGEADGELRLSLPADRGPWQRVSLRVSGLETADLRVEAREASPAQAAQPNGDAFLDVAPGAALRFGLRATLRLPRTELLRGRIAVVADGEELLQLELIVLPAGACPIPV